MHNILFGQINVLSRAALREQKTVEKLAFALARGEIVSDFINRRLSVDLAIARMPIANGPHCEKRRPWKIKYSFSRGKGDKSLIGSSIKIPVTAVKFTREKEITYRIR